MASIIGLIVLFLATLTLGGCAGMPCFGALRWMARGYGDGYGGGYVGPQPYGGMPVPMPMDPGYAAAAPPVVYAPQPQPYYAPQPYAYNYNDPTVYAPAPPPGMAVAPLPPQADPTGSPWIHQRERDQADRSRQGRRDGSLTPHEAQRLGAEQRRRRGAERRMRADGNLSPYERGRLNTMQNRANQDIYGARHNGMGQPGAPGPNTGMAPRVRMGSMRQPGAPVAHPGNGHSGPMNSRGQPQINGAQTHRGMQPQARPTAARRCAESQGGCRGDPRPITASTRERRVNPGAPRFCQSAIPG